MGNCAYCDKANTLTREHVIPNWFRQKSNDLTTFNASAHRTHLKGDIIVKDVCQACNNNQLSALDAYAKSLYEKSLSKTVFYCENITIEIDGTQLLRWLLKISYNSARANNADVNILKHHRKSMLGECPIDNHVYCWVDTITPSVKTKGHHFRAAKRSDKNSPTLIKPDWFRIAQFRMPTYSAWNLVQRVILIDSFCFYLLVKPSEPDPALANVELEVKNWLNEFTKFFPHAKRIELKTQRLQLQAKSSHAMESILPLISHYPNRFSKHELSSEQNNTEKPSSDVPPTVFFITKKETETGDTATIKHALRSLLSTRESALESKQNVYIFINGYDDDSRDLWDIPPARKWLCSLVLDCPFIMWLIAPKSQFIHVLANCWIAEHSKTISDEPEYMAEFLRNCFQGINQLEHSLAISFEQIKQVCITATQFLTIDDVKNEEIH